jgi:tyrosyl-tRNA synthetase
MLLQAYDFEFLLQRHGCRLQIGGSDQWGNITAGCELIRRMGAARDKPAPEVYGLTFPLVTKADGSKYGKSESGNVWLAAEKTSPYQFYQFFLQTADADVGKLLKYFSLKPLAEIEALLAEFAKAPEKREAQKALARELTEMLHGEDELRKVEAATQALFGGDLRALDAGMLTDVFAEAPSTEKPRSVLGGTGYPLADALADTGLCNSKGAARKDLQAGGIYVNNERVQDPQAALTEKDLLAGRFIVLRKGKKTYHLLKF